MEKEYSEFIIIETWGSMEEYKRQMSGPIADYRVFEIEEPKPPTRWERFKSIFST